MKNSQNNQKIMRQQLSEALLNHYCVVLSRRNRIPIQFSDQIRQIEDVGYSILIDLHQTKLNQKSIQHLYKAIKAEMLEKDIGYQYLAEQTTKMLSKTTTIKLGIKTTDTSKFWKNLDCCFVE